MRTHRYQKYRVRPSPTVSVLAGIVGLAFVIFGLTMAIPHAGAFGVLWTLLAAAICIFHFYNAFSTTGIATEIIEVPPASPARSNNLESRLRQLEDLRDKSLITPAEFEQRKAEILREV